MERRIEGVDPFEALYDQRRGEFDGIFARGSPIGSIEEDQVSSKELHRGQDTVGPKGTDNEPEPSLGPGERLPETGEICKDTTSLWQILLLFSQSSIAIEGR